MSRRMEGVYQSRPRQDQSIVTDVTDVARDVMWLTRSGGIVEERQRAGNLANDTSIHRQ